MTLPVHLAVSSPREPDPTYQNRPTDMKGTITINGLIIGSSYALLRYASYKDVPTQGDENAFLQSNFHLLQRTQHMYTKIQEKSHQKDPSIIDAFEYDSFIIHL